MITKGSVLIFWGEICSWDKVEGRNVWYQRPISVESNQRSINFGENTVRGPSRTTREGHLGTASVLFLIFYYLPRKFSIFQFSAILFEFREILKPNTWNQKYACIIAQGFDFLEIKTWARLSSKFLELIRGDKENVRGCRLISKTFQCLISIHH